MDALDIVSSLFSGLVDKAGTPYIEHCRFVGDEAGRIANELHFSDDEIKIVRNIGYLHDVLEDTEYPAENILTIFGKETFDGVIAMTHSPDVSYDDYIEIIKKNRYASIVKLADLTHNSDVTRFKTEKTRKKHAKKSRHYAELAKMMKDHVYRTGMNRNGEISC